MTEQFIRTERLLGKEAMNILSNSKVAVFGIGGVGGQVVEALARCGVGKFDLIDDDVVCTSNLNRQIIATTKTIGCQKTEAMKQRILDINPQAQVEIHNCFFLPEIAGEFDFAQYDYVVDAVDTVTAKLEIILQAKAKNVPVISCMGTGNKLDPTRLEVADIYSTSVCPLAKVMRRELKKRGIDRLKVVYSRENPIRPADIPEVKEGESARTMRRAVPGSTSFVPPAAGLIIASEVVRDLIV
ncbi:tRNA threonylcarbamoyladenosine dehydratase [Parasporobacterium paucivorans]|uniref:tRNA A37 threonylcarbamoyladenosine dehydratase n=1 Tax=Parasporobacterium paucivorans DSM 15970 TaxID=1122934 RepID=A0A1M6GJK4_9FIRM|nr:tRNA threonylcarbamoyladenosine dehydratase [Parasporobacterium paucivorans]SHJ10070.1 tRNA A37 threonylcarbamoyladenosine dehydratase [Parasporobacterium paucivorans DSM 15970]